MADFTEEQLKDAARKALAAGDRAAAKRLVDAARAVAARTASPPPAPAPAGFVPPSAVTAPGYPPPQQITPVQPADAPPPPTQSVGPVAGAVSSLMDGLRQGPTMVLGAPVDIVNNLPRLANLIPGVDGVGPITAEPVGGSASIDRAVRTASGAVSVAGSVAANAMPRPATGNDYADIALRYAQGISNPALGLIDALFSGPSIATDSGTLGLPATPDYQPQNATERILNRTGQEIGAAAVPVAGAIGKARGMLPGEAARMATAPTSVREGLAGQFLLPATVNPTGLAAREGYYAGAAGLGAGAANELAGDNQGWVSDLLGALAGVGIGATGAGLVGAGGNALAAMTGSGQFIDDVAQSAVADRIIRESSAMQEQAARLQAAGIAPDALSTDSLVRALRSKAPVEEAVPGYQANIADRTQDPGLASFVYNTDTIMPGAATARRNANEGVVNAQMRAMAPQGDPSQFRADLQAGVDNRLTAVQGQVDQAQGVFDNLVAALQPIMQDATARGSSIRAALADAYATAQEGVRAQYGALDQRGTLIDPTDLVTRTKAVDTNLAPNDAKRFRPTEADTIAQMMPGDRAPLRDTGLVNEFNRPIFAETGVAPAANGLPSLPGESIGRPGTTVPLSDISAIRSGLTDDLRVAKAAGRDQEARIIGQYIDTIDGFLETNLPDGLRQALTEARASRRDVADRFERPGTALADILSTRQGGDYAMDPSTVPPRLVVPDQGRVTDFGAAWREAGTDPRLRAGVTDEIKSQVVQGRLLDKPEALGRWMADRQIVLADFPELRAQLEAAGASRATLDAAEKTAKTVTRDLTTPGRSAEASYLRNVEDPGAAIRTAVNSPDPRKAVTDLVTTAGTPQARQDLRAALWEEVKRGGKMDAPGITGETRWNGKKLRAMFEDPKFSAVAQELWKDDPEDLANIKRVFDALATAEGSTRARAPNSSGTAQSLTGKFDAALSASSVASRGRSVSRGQLSPAIAGIDLLATWLRRRSAQMQSRNIDKITALVVNNPGMAADLLERYNPATAGAYRAMLTQKYGVRATQLLNMLDEAEQEDPLLSAMEDQ